jgi:hypothetical protein
MQFWREGNNKYPEAGKMKNTLVLSITVFTLITGFTQASTIAELSGFGPGTHATIDEAVILSTTDLVADPGVKSFQIRDLTGAITIYGSNAHIDAALSGFDVGSVIQITGSTARRDGMLMLDGIPEGTGGNYGGFAVSGRSELLPIYSGAILATPFDLADWSPVAESLESNLIRLQNVSFDNTGFFVTGFDYTLSGGPAMVRIATDGLGLTGMPIPGGLLNITGILIQDDPSNPVLSGINYRIEPRGPQDIVFVPEPCTLLLLAFGSSLTIRR